MKMSMRICCALALLLCMVANTNAASFGPTVVVSPVTVGRIYQGYGNGVYVRFVGQTLTGCIGNGGYLRPSWSVANGSVDNETLNRMLTILLMAKAQDLQLEVRFRVNSMGTGWDSCSIDGLYLF